MRYGAIDLHKKQSSICICSDGQIGQEGKVFEEFEIPTSRDQFILVFAKRPPMRILIESSTESEWVARLLEGLGHEVVVADPNYVLMYASRSARIKTDRRDARALCEACGRGHYRVAYRIVEPWRSVRRLLSQRCVLVRARTAQINLTRAFLRQEGLRPPACKTEHFARRIGAMELPAELSDLRELVTQGCRIVKRLTLQIMRIDLKLEVWNKDERIKRLMSAPGVGVVTALAYASAVGESRRFASGEQVSAYLGLVPGENSSSERRRVGRITKTGDTRTRWLLVEAGWRVLRSREKDQTQEVLQLARWGRRLAERRGKAKAAVAIARKLATRMWAMDLSGRDYDARQIHSSSSQAKTERSTRKK